MSKWCNLYDVKCEEAENLIEVSDFCEFYCKGCTFECEEGGQIEE